MVEVDVQQQSRGSHTAGAMPHHVASSPLAVPHPPPSPPSHEEDTDLAVSEVIESLMGDVAEQVASMKGLHQQGCPHSMKGGQQEGSGPGSPRSVLSHESPCSQVSSCHVRANTLLLTRPVSAYKRPIRSEESCRFMVTIIKQHCNRAALLCFAVLCSALLCSDSLCSALLCSSAPQQVSVTTFSPFPFTPWTHLTPRA